MHEHVCSARADDPSQPQPQRLMRAFHRVLHSNRQLMLRRLGDHGSHPGQAMCLRELSRNDGITQRDLAELLDVARPTVTVMLQKMEKAGLIERRADATDQRFTRIFLTEEGRRLHAEMHRMFEEISAEVIGSMAEEDVAELVRLLDLVNDNIQAALANRGPATEPALPVEE